MCLAISKQFASNACARSHNTATQPLVSWRMTFSDFSEARQFKLAREERSKRFGGGFANIRLQPDFSQPAALLQLWRSSYFRFYRPGSFAPALWKALRNKRSCSSKRTINIV